ncbi:MAG: glycosyl transferase [Janthinobacterium lividum]
MAEAIRIFVGCDPNDCDLEQMAVLEYSLRQHASMPVEIHWMQLSRDPASPWYADPAHPENGGWRTEQWATPFSGFRWAIPALCNFTGRALYLDADILALRDVAELWSRPFEPGKALMAKGRKNSWRFCVMLWDCAAARDLLPPLDELKRTPDAHANLTRRFSEHTEAIQALHADDNNIDGEDKPIEQIRLLHYSDMGTQLSHPHAMPRLAAEGQRHWFDGRVLPHPRKDLQALFDRYYRAALAAGVTLDQYRAPARFGALVKASQASYKGNRRTRRRSLWSRLTHLFVPRRDGQHGDTPGASGADDARP